MTATSRCPIPLQYFAPPAEGGAGQKLASSPAVHSVLVATTASGTAQLTSPQRLSPERDTAYGLPCETVDHV